MIQNVKMDPQVAAFNFAQTVFLNLFNQPIDGNWMDAAKVVDMHTIVSKEGFMIFNASAMDACYICALYKLRIAFWNY